ncbi:hypothetical protein [Halomarina litorea]|uniref:hypothetical protein n=1 Tax=Halomarina litorea TaxID=2961595 RepID=UPI0020C2C8B4|nr:hypothetical protein [Halomarina sp. BCD28]
MGLKRWGMLLFGVGVLAASVLFALTDPLTSGAFPDCAGAHTPTFTGVGPEGIQFTNGCNVISYAHPAMWGALLVAVGVIVGSVGVVREFRESPA